jgi:signal transduction histidine kinase
VRVHSRLRPSPALIWHFNVLGRLLAQVYLAKQREVKLKQQSYVQAVHETGAKLTHDVKNLLQSLSVLCSAAEQERGDPAQLQAMIRRHLPVVTQRLQATLDKLQRPNVETGRFIRPDAWWEAIQRSYVHPAVSFEADISNLMIGPMPRDLFETAADNLINNALEKRRLDPTVVVTVRFECSDRIAFSVSDTGKAVSREVVRSLFQGPVSSETGYGIGLFQLYRQAEASDYKLRLLANDPGKVCFELASA